MRTARQIGISPNSPDPSPSSEFVHLTWVFRGSQQQTGLFSEIRLLSREKKLGIKSARPWGRTRIEMLGKHSRLGEELLNRCNQGADKKEKEQVKTRFK